MHGAMQWLMAVMQLLVLCQMLYAQARTSHTCGAATAWTATSAGLTHAHSLLPGGQSLLCLRQCAVWLSLLLVEADGLMNACWIAGQLHHRAGPHHALRRRLRLVRRRAAAAAVVQAGCSCDGPPSLSQGICVRCVLWL